jgi:hypothetical protein
VEESTAVTASEAYLGNLCRSAFLHLWSYPNLYRDQGKGKRTEGKELCDLLVVFGDDLLIFSDKHCALREDRPLQTSWRRWYRDAVLTSAKQISGAERWLLEHPDRVFTDRECSRPFPIQLPKSPRIHRIVTCRGAAGGSRGHWGGSGSLLVTNRPLADCSELPFYLGCFDERSKMVHVFDEVGLDEVLTTLDTASDFCSYLTKRELFFRKYQMIVAPGEEDLLAFYLRGVTPGTNEHDFIVQYDVTGIALDESFGKWWAQSEERRAKAAADRVSYCWDRLIEKFSHHMANGTQYFPREGGVREGEALVRWMARENRVRRRQLASMLLEAMETKTPGRLRRRYFLPQSPGDPFWVFLVLPRPDRVSYEEYREFRRAFLLSHCYVIKYLNPNALDVAGIAVEPREEEISEDAIYLDCRSWTPEENARAKELHERAGIFTNATRTEVHEWEFPDPERSGPSNGSDEGDI